MNALRRVWEHFEEGFIAFLLAAMTLITFVYVILNNFYTLFYWLGDAFGGNELLLGIGDAILDMAQAMTWSNALTKAMFGWLIFFGLAYGVRTAGHIGVDALVKLIDEYQARYERSVYFVDTSGRITLDGVPLDEYRLADLRRRSHHPAVAIGGVKAHTLAELAGSGVEGVAVVSAICAAADVPAATRELREALATSPLQGEL